MPSGKCLVLDLHAREDIKVSGEAEQRLPVNRVPDRDLDFWQCIENVELREVESCVSVNEARVAEYDEVEPAASSAPTGSGTILCADFLKVYSNVLQECKV